MAGSSENAYFAYFNNQIGGASTLASRGAGYSRHLTPLGPDTPGSMGEGDVGRGAGVQHDVMTPSREAVVGPVRKKTRGIRRPVVPARGMPPLPQRRGGGPKRGASRSAVERQSARRGDVGAPRQNKRVRKPSPSTIRDIFSP